MPKVMHFYLDLSYEKFLNVYKGHADAVVARATDGRTIQFPANCIKQFLTPNGIQGFFLIEFDNNNKFQSIKKLS